jgi:hypothetical protein
MTRVIVVVAKPLGIAVHDRVLKRAQAHHPGAQISDSQPSPLPRCPFWSAFRTRYAQAEFFRFWPMLSIKKLD